MLVKKQKTYSLLDDDDGDRSSAQSEEERLRDQREVAIGAENKGTGYNRYTKDEAVRRSNALELNDLENLRFVII
ncbi:hypothetical protein GBA52_021836 [Prunus armeniaca]|nr:hypothetical protein GBA52_021836 [Prunus armeniaca]